VVVDLVQKRREREFENEQKDENASREHDGFWD